MRGTSSASKSSPPAMSTWVGGGGWQGWWQGWGVWQGACLGERDWGEVLVSGRGEV